MPSRAALPPNGRAVGPDDSAPQRRPVCNGSRAASHRSPARSRSPTYRNNGTLRKPRRRSDHASARRCRTTWAPTNRLSAGSGSTRTPPRRGDADATHTLSRAEARHLVVQIAQLTAKRWRGCRHDVANTTSLRWFVMARTSWRLHLHFCTTAPMLAPTTHSVPAICSAPIGWASTTKPIAAAIAGSALIRIPNADALIRRSAISSST